MTFQKSELYAPSEHYQSMGTSSEQISAYAPTAMEPAVLAHVEHMMLAAEKAIGYQECDRLCQYVTGYIGHASLTRTCTFEERKSYWERIDKALCNARQLETLRGSKWK